MHRLVTLIFVVAFVSCAPESTETVTETDSVTGTGTGTATATATATETTSGAELSCVDQVISGVVPLSIGAIDTREQGDDFTPSFVVGAQGAFEDLVYAWTPEASGEVELLLRREGPIPDLDNSSQRKLYMLVDCGVAGSGGVLGSDFFINATAGSPVLFAVEGCEGDCRIDIRVYEPENNT